MKTIKLTNDKDEMIVSDEAVIAFYGEFACTNFPREEYEKCSVHP